MSIHLINKMWGLDPDALTSGQRWVLMALADSADDEGGCFPQYAFIAWKVGIAKRTVSHHLKSLEEAGWIERHRRIRGRLRRGYEYHINIQKLEDSAVPKPVAEWQEVATSSGKKLPLKERQEVASHMSGKKLPLPSTHQLPINKYPPTTTSPFGVKTNKWDGTCIVCQCVVEAGTGVLVGKSVKHSEGKCAVRRRISPVSKHETDEEWED